MINGCAGTLKSNLSVNEILQAKPHSHGGDQAAVDAEKARQNIKEKCVESRDTPAQIFAATVVSLDQRAKEVMSSKTNCKQVIRYHRKKNLPKTPTTLKELSIESEWQTTGGSNPKTFLRYDNGTDAASRIVIFASEECPQLLSRSKTWYMDGNFKMSPKLFMQLYVIRVPLVETAVSVVYILLQKKTQTTYEEMLKAIVDQCNQMSLYPDPERVLVDFVAPVINAVKNILGVEVSGCFYHKKQCTWRKIQSLGLVSHYEQNEDFSIFCGMIDGLAFLPVTKVPDGYSHLH